MDYIRATKENLEKVEEGLEITPGHEGILDALAIDNPLEYVVMYLEGSMQSWAECENEIF